LVVFPCVSPAQLGAKPLSFNGLQATVAKMTSRISATTLLASVEPCSAPVAAPLRDFFALGHHAARQRGAMFSTSRRASTRSLRLGPPRCSPAWSHVQHQPPCLYAISSSSATTLLASVEPCSSPAGEPLRDFFALGHHAARQRGAMFITSRRASTRFLRLGPPRCSPAWSHVHHQSPRLYAISSPWATTLLASVEPCSAPVAVPLRDFFALGHHAACQRGAMFRTRHRPAPCFPYLEHRPTLASSVVAKNRNSGTALVLNIAPRWRAAWWRRIGIRGQLWF